MFRIWSFCQSRARANEHRTGHPGAARRSHHRALGDEWHSVVVLPRNTGELANASLESVDEGGAVSRACPPQRVLGCVVHAACSTAEPGCSIHSSGNGLIVGEPDGSASPRLDAVVARPCARLVNVTVSSKIQQDIWYKLWGNMTMNPISALTRATSDRILDDPLVKSFVLRVMVEAADLGARFGCPIAESGEARTVMLRSSRVLTSMLQDVEAGRALEIDALVAAPREIARRLGMATQHGRPA